MESIQKTIEVDAPVRKVYNQWTQFEDFPKFMEGIEQVRQIDDKHLHWIAEVGGKTKEWDAEIVDQVPDQKISWRSTSGVRNSGVVNFRPKGQDHTVICLEMYYEPESAMEKAADAIGVLSRKVEGDLERFREFIQRRNTETGSWRGEIRGREIRQGNETADGSKGTMNLPPDYDNSGKSGLSS